MNKGAVLNVETTEQKKRKAATKKSNKKTGKNYF